MKPDRAQDTVPPEEAADATDPGDPPVASASADEETAPPAPIAPIEDGWDVATIPDAVDVEHLILSLGETRPAPLPRQGRPRGDPDEHSLLSYPSPSTVPAAPMTLSRRPPPAPMSARWGWVWMGGAILVGLGVFASVVVMSRTVEPSGPPSAGTPGYPSTPREVSAVVFDLPAPRTPRLEAIPEPPVPRAEPRRAAKRTIASASPAGSPNAAPAKKPVFGDW